MTTPENDRPLEPGTIIANNYRVTTRLGAGGMGTVYLAENVTLNQKVVVKVLRGGAQGAGQEEAQIMANLQHPNIVTVYAHDPALDCIVMEFLDGASLSTLLEKGIDRVNAIRIALAVAEALAAVHKRGLVHRDIKPENVMLALNLGGGGGRLVDWLKLIDFGLALKTGKLPQVLLGTPEFCGPEQFLIEEAAHPANDVYALGVTIFLMMTGVFPFDGPREELPHLHFNQPPPRLLEALVSRFGADSFDPRTHALLEDLDELLQQMLAKAVADRPTAQEVARRLIRLESSFAEAGTYVGSASQPIALVTEATGASRRRSGTAVLSQAPRATPFNDTAATQTVATLSDEAVAARQPKSNRGLIIALSLLVLALAAGVGVLSRGPAVEEVVKVEVPETVQTPPPVVDAGMQLAVAPDAGELEELAQLSNIKKPRPLPPRPPKPPACHYDEAFANDARRTLAELGKGASREKKDELEDLGDELHDAFRAKDCKAVEAVLKKMRLTVAR